MASSGDPSYFGREQSQIKHLILEKYLERFAIIVGRRYDTILYVDGFSGPWNVQSDNLKDASFSIALNQLRRARGIVKTGFKKDLRIKCVFLEKEPAPFALLKKFADDQADAEVTALNRDFESAVPDIVKLVNEAGGNVFPFIFIDPTGWTGFSLPLITPLLRIQPCEVLINFMTGFIVRFAEDARSNIGSGFEGLFGDATFRERCRGVDGKEREDALVFEYAEKVGQAGNFAHVPITVITHPTKDRTHFHLVYATRSLKGVEVFKEAERKALDLTIKLRADAKRREREARTSQSEMFTGAELPETAYMQELTAHYGAIARKAIHVLIQKKSSLPFDEVYATGMRYPLVQIGALRSWISEIADIENLGPREKFAKLGGNHLVRFRAAP